MRVRRNLEIDLPGGLGFPINRTLASDAEFAARVAEIEAAPDAEESLRERVARALWERLNPTYLDILSPGELDEHWSRLADGQYHGLAEAAIAICRGDA